MRASHLITLLAHYLLLQVSVFTLEKVYKVLVIFSVLVASAAQVLLKKGASYKHDTFWRQYINPWVICGYLILGGSLLINVFCLGHGVLVKEVSILESLSYFFVPVLSWLAFRESISAKKIGAIFTIFVGILIFFI